MFLDTHDASASATLFPQQDGRLMLFARTSGNLVMYTEQNFVNDNGGWSPLHSPNVNSLTDVAVNIFGGSVVVVGVNTNTKHLFFVHQTTADSDSWSAPVDMGGVANGTPSVTSNGGALDVFVRGTDNALYARHIRPRWGLSPSGGWKYYGTPSSGGITNDVSAFTEPTASFTDDPPKTYVFCREGNSSAMSSYSFLGDISGLTDGSWRSHGGIITSTKVGVSNNTVNGTMEVFSRGNDGALYHQWQTSHHGSWTTWAGLGLLPGNVTIASNPAVGWLPDTSLNVFVIGDNSTIYARRQSAPASSWNAWLNLGGRARSHPAAGRNTNGTLEVFVVGTDGRLYRNSSNSSGAFSSGGWGAVTPDTAFPH